MTTVTTLLCLTALTGCTKLGAYDIDDKIAQRIGILPATGTTLVNRFEPGAWPDWDGYDLCAVTRDPRFATPELVENAEASFGITPGSINSYDGTSYARGEVDGHRVYVLWGVETPTRSPMNACGNRVTGLAPFSFIRISDEEQ